MRQMMRIAMMAMIGILLAGCAGTGMRTEVARSTFCEPPGNPHPQRPLESCGY